jgi:hypothetical protein
MQIGVMSRKAPDNGGDSGQGECIFGFPILEKGGIHQIWNQNEKKCAYN